MMVNTGLAEKNVDILDAIRQHDGPIGPGLTALVVANRAPAPRTTTPDLWLFDAPWRGPAEDALDLALLIVAGSSDQAERDRAVLTAINAAIQGHNQPDSSAPPKRARKRFSGSHTNKPHMPPFCG